VKIQQTIELLDGPVTVTFDDSRHRYEVDGKVVPGVTTVLGIVNKPALVPWAAKMAAEEFTRQIKPGVAYDEVSLSAIAEDIKRSHRAKTAAAATVGTIVHDWVEEFLRMGRPPADPVNEAAQNGVLAWLEWWRANEVRPAMVERIIYHPEGYAGRVDFVGEVNGRRMVADIKTSSGVWPEMWLQVHAYAAALTQEGWCASEVGIIHLDKDSGEMTWHTRPITQRETDAWFAALDLYRWQAGEEKARRAAL
jgi:hypothetical protein